MITNAVTFFKKNQVSPFPENTALILAVWEIKKPENIGQIIRLAHNAGAEKVLFINDNPEFINPKIKKTAGFSFEQMNWEFVSTSDFLALLKTDFKLVILETCSGSENIFNVELPEKSIILAGNEAFGIPSEIIAMGKIKVHIPMPGACKSMNISHALSVAAFEWYRQNSTIPNS